MEVNVIPAKTKYLKDCVIALRKSDLGSVYFPEDDKAIKAIEEGILKKEIFVAISSEGICLGFIWFILKGAFHSFSYLHIIAVKEEFRSMGIGRMLLKYFEDTTLKYSNKLFLVVADFNPKAKELYQRMGYKEIGIIPNLYKKGVNECLMIKEIGA